MNLAEHVGSHESHDHQPGGGDTTILVNEHSVHFHHHTVTGLQIKAGAIKAGVRIEEDFILYEEHPDGGSRVIGNEEEVRLRHNLRFVAKPDKHEVVVSVNEQAVKLRGKTATGAEIKAEAIKQGVHIQQNFVLQEELPNGMSRVVGDADLVHLREHLRFTAIAPDDNS